MTIILLSNGDYIAFPTWFYKFWHMRLYATLGCLLFDYNQYTGEEIIVMDVVDSESSAELETYSEHREFTSDGVIIRKQVPV